LPCVAVCCRVLPCVAVYCSVLQCVAVCCSVLQGVAGCCRVQQCFAKNPRGPHHTYACVCISLSFRKCATDYEEWRMPKGGLIFTGYFSQKSPTIRV